MLIAFAPIVHQRLSCGHCPAMLFARAIGSLLRMNFGLPSGLHVLTRLPHIALCAIYLSSCPSISPPKRAIVAFAEILCFAGRFALPFV